MRARRAKVIPATATRMPPRWTSIPGTTLIARRPSYAARWLEQRSTPRRHPSGGLRRLTRSERKRRGQRFGRQMRVQWRAAILGVAQSDIPKGGTGWIVLRGPTVSADPSTGSGKDWTMWTCEG